MKKLSVISREISFGILDMDAGVFPLNSLPPTVSFLRLGSQVPILDGRLPARWFIVREMDCSIEML